MLVVNSPWTLASKNLEAYCLPTTVVYYSAGQSVLLL